MTQMNEGNALTQIEAAESAIQRLADKRNALNTRRAQIDKQRGMNSYAAHVEDDPKAKTLIAALATEVIKLDQEAASLDAALDTAKQKLEQAQATELQAETRKAAKQARANYKRFGDNGSKIAEHLMAASMLIDATKKLNDDNHALGYQHPNWQLFQVNLERAISTWIMTLPLRRGYEHRYLSPQERTDIGRLLADWSQSGIRQIDQQFSNLSGNGAAKEAAHA